MKKLILLILLGLAFALVLLNAKGIVRLVRNASDKNPSQENSVVAGNCATDSIASKLDVSYGASELDIYYPEGTDCKNLPVMLYVHGGGWQKGDKSQQVKDKIPYFVGQGFVFVSVNYRLAPEFKYPVFNEDVAQAMAWVSQNISKYGGNPKKLSLIGHSAGGTIVASVGVDASYLNNVNVPRTDLRCVVALDSGSYDLSEAAVNKSDRTLVALFTGDVYKQAFGDDPETLKEASPINNIVNGSYIPSFFIVTRGQADRVALVKQFSDKLVRAGAFSQLVLATGLSHNEVNDAVGLSSDKLVTPPLTDFLAKCR